MRFLIGGWVVMVLLSLVSVEAIFFEVSNSGPKCVSEEIHSNVVVLADYSVIGDEDHHVDVIPTISAKVTSPYGNNLHHQENVTHAQFSFTTTEAGNYLACFWLDGKNKSEKPVTISLEWRTGIAAKDWDSVAKKEHIEGLELELTKLEGLVDAIHENLNYLKNREAELRHVSETTNTRVARFSLMALSFCIIVSVFQLWYLKRYFQKKKLI